MTNYGPRGHPHAEVIRDLIVVRQRPIAEAMHATGMTKDAIISLCRRRDWRYGKSLTRTHTWRTCPTCKDRLKPTQQSVLWCSCGRMYGNQGGVYEDMP